MTPDDMAYIERHILEAGRTELRTISPDGRVMLGVFDEPVPLTSAIWHHRQETNCYLTIQAPRLMPATNELRRARRGDGIRNDDISHFIRVVFDFDAVRPKAEAASELHLEYTWEAAIALRMFLYRQGWPLPAVTMSGNGHHLTYRTPPIANIPDHREDLRTIYRGLANDFGNEAVTFDMTVRNPGRIIRVPGSFNVKVPSDPRAVSIELPSRWRQVRPVDIGKLARLYRVLGKDEGTSPAQAADQCDRKPFDGSGDYSTLDVVAWFGAHGHYIQPIEDRKHAVRCPWSNDHTTAFPSRGGDSIIFESEGPGKWPGYFCHHDHCEGRDIRNVFDIWGDADAFCGRQWWVV